MVGLRHFSSNSTAQLHALCQCFQSRCGLTPSRHAAQDSGQLASASPFPGYHGSTLWGGGPGSLEPVSPCHLLVVWLQRQQN